MARQDVATGAAVVKMPGHWVLARAGKRVLRPGGRALTRRMVRALDVGPEDQVVELAPGLGVTAALLVSARPASYVGVEADPDAAATVRTTIGDRGSVITAPAQRTPLETGSATVVVGEAMLTMQNPANKHAVVAEAASLLAPGGRYAIHELCVLPEDVDPATQRELASDLSRTIHVGARPLTVSGWTALLGEHGFDVTWERRVAMGLLQPGRVVRDEGIARALGFAAGVLRDAEARARVRGMRACFSRWRSHLGAVALVARRRDHGGTATRTAGPETPLTP